MDHIPEKVVNISVTMFSMRLIQLDYLNVIFFSYSLYISSCKFGICNRPFLLSRIIVLPLYGIVYSRNNLCVDLSNFVRICFELSPDLLFCNLVLHAFMLLPTSTFEGRRLLSESQTEF